MRIDPEISRTKIPSLSFCMIICSLSAAYPFGLGLTPIHAWHVPFSLTKQVLRASKSGRRSRRLGYALLESSADLGVFEGEGLSVFFVVTVTVTPADGTVEGIDVPRPRLSPWILGPVFNSVCYHFSFLLLIFPSIAIYHGPYVLSSLFLMFLKIFSISDNPNTL
jgi:hypothetical protein